ncbi:hypothetical protein SAMN05661044_04880 [Olivibacter domesticus]|uniref:Uncharacterized protein n=1 Tax=Olivibacter domesticus TaxID=407022 RepID=A0A1H7XI04_OLID1|nr:hypothetical protein SAMN05661044_04880 [Olivibacter domesticus]
MERQNTSVKRVPNEYNIYLVKVLFCQKYAGTYYLKDNQITSLKEFLT